MRRSRILFVCLLMLGGCATPDSAARPGPHAAPTSKAGTGTATIAPSTVDLAYARMTPQQRVGQLFMFGVTSTGPSKEMYDELAEHTTGNVFLRGPSDLGAEATVKITNRMKTVATVAGVGPFISADQEGGNAQSLQGKGFSEIPTGVTQGEQQPRDLRADARSWSRELLAAGVNLDLAPIADVVPAEIGVSNEPIGLFRRQYGSTPETASAGVQAFVRGMQKGAVATSLKHFPGLGRATGNTDSDPAATDPTVRGDALLEPFAAGVRVGSAFVMVSSAKYPGIDPDRRACFSSVVMRDMLRGDLGFHGVVISDSFGSASVSSVPAGRARDPLPRGRRHHGARHQLPRRGTDVDRRPRTDGARPRLRRPGRGQRPTGPAGQGEVRPDRLTRATCATPGTEVALSDRARHRTAARRARHVRDLLPARDPPVDVCAEQSTACGGPGADHGSTDPDAHSHSAACPRSGRGPSRHLDAGPGRHRGRPRARADPSRPRPLVATAWRATTVVIHAAEAVG